MQYGFENTATKVGIAYENGKSVFSIFVKMDAWGA